MTPERNEKGQWKKGASGNPAGRKPDGLSLTSILRQQLQEVPEGETEIRAVLLVERYLEDMSKGLAAGDPRAGVAFRDMVDRIDGKPREMVQYGTENYEEWRELFSREHEEEMNNIIDFPEILKEVFNVAGS